MKQIQCELGKEVNKTGMLFLQNNTFLDPNYYWSIKTKSQTIRLIRDEEKHPFVGNWNIFITSDVFKTLERTNWLNSDIIDGYIASIVHSFKNTAYFPARYTEFIFQENKSFERTLPMVQKNIPCKENVDKVLFVWYR